jgi:hypothetical protein
MSNDIKHGISSISLLEHMDGSVPVQLTSQGVMLVEGIEYWIQGLVSIQSLKDIQKEGVSSLCVQDYKTGAKFLIARVEE